MEPGMLSTTATARRSLVVVGDVLLDETIEGQVDRICPEAPVPVIDELRRTSRPGGAGLAALLAARDGHQVTLIGALGDDLAARNVRASLAAEGIALINLGTSAPTVIKTRVRASGQTLFRVDRTDSDPAYGSLPEAGRIALQSASAILVSDYGRGVTAVEDIREHLGRLVAAIPVVWDPHPNGPAPVGGVAVVTPNRREAVQFAAGLAGNGLAADVERARSLVRVWGCGAVVITRGSDGAVLVGDDMAPPLVVPVSGASGGDSCGAGDLFAGVLAALLGAGEMPSVAVTQAVAAASKFVTEGSDRHPIRSLPAGSDAVAVAARTRATGGTVVATAGCFDLLHRGHITMLEAARRLGDCLIVCVNSDESVTRLKGPSRPVTAVHDRVGVLSALSCVDAVLVFGEDTPAEALELIQPQIYVKGGDYGFGELPEQGVVERGGGQIVLLPYLDGRSTTLLIDRAVRSTGRVG
jgi:D-beta-D-heptose 7-phosphate kinase/D-beta-D-heptose 1-phosphate adenosyltransferase